MTSTDPVRGADAVAVRGADAPPTPRLDSLAAPSTAAEGSVAPRAAHPTSPGAPAPQAQPPGPGTATRATRQQAAIREYLVASSDFRTAQQIHDHLTTLGRRVSLPTVYRVLTRLVDAGEVDPLRLASGQTAYRLCRSHQHHHHLICRRCHVAVEIAGESLERWIAETVRQYGFTAVDHDIELFGLCAVCAATGAAAGEGSPD